MRDAVINTKRLNGNWLYYCIVAGAKRLIQKQDYLNHINVFPVADSDTGNNMASAMRAIIETTNPTPIICEMAQAIADAALWGGHGNSGIILGQFLYGFSEG